MHEQEHLYQVGLLQKTLVVFLDLYIRRILLKLEGVRRLFVWPRFITTSRSEGGRRSQSS